MEFLKEEVQEAKKRKKRKKEENREANFLKNQEE